MPLRFGFLLRCAALSAICFASCGMDSVARAEDSFPYTARVSGTNVRVRSGPGKNYYVTQELQYGDEVEIYRHDPGGWYAVRPPERSYSWVSARYLQLREDGTGTITGDRVVARVGSLLNQARDVIQVRLERGEQVQVLETQRLADGATAETWHKIAPPPGEFRWIYGKYVQTELPPSLSVSSGGGNLLVEKIEEAASRRQAGPPEELQTDEAGLLSVYSRAAPAPTADDRIAIDDDRPVRLAGSAQVETEAIGIVAENEAEQTEPAEGWSSVSPTSDAAIRPEPARISIQNSADQSTSSVTPPGSREVEVGSVEHRQRAGELDLLLSSIVAEDPSRWDFTQLRSEAEALLTAGETAIERGRARLLLKKIDRFDDIRRRYGAVRQLADETQTRDRQLDTIAATRVDPLDDAQRRYDGRGRLTRVVSRRIGAPRYALLSRTGEVLSYVTPAPGVNLRPFVGQEVGVTGSRGYMTEYERQHVTAQRITVLHRPLVR